MNSSCNITSKDYLGFGCCRSQNKRQLKVKIKTKGLEVTYKTAYKTETDIQNLPL